MCDRNSYHPSVLIEHRTATAARKYARGNLNARARILKFPRRAYLALSSFPVRTLWIANDCNRFTFDGRAVIHFECRDLRARRVRLQECQIGVCIGRDNALNVHRCSCEGFDANKTGLLDDVRICDDATRCDEKSTALELWRATFVISGDDDDRAFDCRQH